jgi:hypothetical protein
MIVLLNTMIFFPGARLRGSSTASMSSQQSYSTEEP